MVFRVFAVFSHNNDYPTPQDKYSPQLFRNTSNAPLTETKWQRGNHHPSCQHSVSQQYADFCPYCSRPGTTTGVFGQAPTPPQQRDNSPVRRRKLRKVKPDYQQLRHESPITQTIAPTRPESILSTHSRTPLLDRAANSNYAPRRTPNKLEKRDKIRRMTSMAASSSFGFMTLGAGSSESSSSSTRNDTISGRLPTRSPSSIITTDFVSLAWTGELQTENSAPGNPTSSFQVPDTSSLPQNRPRPRTKSDYSIGRNSVLRKSRDVDAQKDSSPRPWSLAMVVSDDKITDEKLVDQLEDMRTEGLSQRQQLLLSVSSASPSYRTVLDGSYAEYPPEPGEFSTEDLSNSWNTARQALLICREMLRTERRYLSSLRILSKGATTTFPPLTMLYHLPRLIVASEAFLQSMTKNPSVRGVSDAFLAIKEDLDEAFVNWCSVVGAFFADSKPRSDFDQPVVVKLRRVASSPILDARNSTAERVVIIEPKKIRRNSKARPSVRELAILPTQRIVRYVLLFKELSTLTPPSSAYSLVVAQALHAAQLIAKHSDEAQVHAAFIAPTLSRVGNF